MPQYFNFARLINKYSGGFTSLTFSEGYYDEAGDWVKGETIQTDLQGAIINHRESKIFRSEGTLTTKDKRLFTLAPLSKDVLQLATVYHDGKKYSLIDESENAEFTGVYAYTMKYVSAFKEETKDFDITADVDRFNDRLDGVFVESEETPPPSETGTSRLEKRLDGVLID